MGARNSTIRAWGNGEVHMFIQIPIGRQLYVLQQQPNRNLQFVPSERLRGGMTVARHEDLAQSLAEAINQSQAVVDGNCVGVSLDEYRNLLETLVTGLADPSVFGSHIDLDEARTVLGEAVAILANMSTWDSAPNELNPKLVRFLASVHANDL